MRGRKRDPLYVKKFRQILYYCPSIRGCVAAPAPLFLPLVLVPTANRQPAVSTVAPSVLKMERVRSALASRPTPCRLPNLMRSESEARLRSNQPAPHEHGQRAPVAGARGPRVPQLAPRGRWKKRTTDDDGTPLGSGLPLFFRTASRIILKQAARGGGERTGEDKCFLPGIPRQLLLPCAFWQRRSRCSRP